MNATCRVDVKEGTVLTWHDLPNFGMPAGPPTFLPRPGGDPLDETDGVVLVDCLGVDGRAFFVVLSGATFAKVARVVLPYRHCATYNSTWVWDR